MCLQKIYIFLIQEHNIKEKGKLEYAKKYCKIFIGFTHHHKGGAAILFNKLSKVDNILNHEFDVNGYIISVKCRYFNTPLQIVNVYTPSGSGKKMVREELFQKDLVYFLRDNIQNLMLGGDWNSITSKRHCSNPDRDLLSPAFASLKKNNLKLKNVWFVTNNSAEFTYFRTNYGSRLDRLYVNNVGIVENIPLSWFDHSMIKSSFKLDNVCHIGKGYWKLNTSILTQNIVKDNFGSTSELLKHKKSNFTCLLEWWQFVKKHLKFFFHKSIKNV